MHPLILLAMLRLLFSLLAASPESPPPLELEALLSEVSAQAPQLRAQEAAVDVARARVGVEGAWEDPTMDVMAESIPLRGGPDAPMPMLTWRFTQPLNVFGRRGLANEAAGAQVKAELARLRRSGWDVRAQALSAFLELWMNQEMRSLLDVDARGRGLVQGVRRGDVGNVRAVRVPVMDIAPKATRINYSVM